MRHNYHPHIVIHKTKDFEKMRVSGRLAAEVLDYITDYVQPDVTTNSLDELCNKFIVSRGAIPACLNYRGFPKSICTSINEVVCHGIPGDRKLISGDIINIDVTVIVNGWYGDSSRMYTVGEVSPAAQKLIAVTYQSMMLGIEAVRPGAHFGDIGHAIQQYAQTEGYSVVRDYTGHGIGRHFHDEPHVFNYGIPGQGPEIKKGMFFTIEPMLNIGGHETVVGTDQWTVSTKDKSLSAQFEHTIGVTETGFEIFTSSPKKLLLPPY